MDRRLIVFGPLFFSRNEVFDFVEWQRFYNFVGYITLYKGNEEICATYVGGDGCRRWVDDGTHGVG